jgi:mannose-6-phosphate isomerase-like protein (cupin superfamily)
MTDRKRYSIHTDVRFKPLELIDVPSIVAACREVWFNQTLCRVNDCVVRLGILKGEFHWHQHQLEDEFFFVIDGRLMIDLAGKTVELGPRQGFTVPRGVEHRTRAPQGVVVLMVEGGEVVPTGD